MINLLHAHCHHVILLDSLSRLPGIAGIVLTMGMAVDSNVLVFERMREEWRNGRTALERH